MGTASLTVVHSTRSPVTAKAMIGALRASGLHPTALDNTSNETVEVTKPFLIQVPNSEAPAATGILKIFEDVADRESAEDARHYRPRPIFGILSIVCFGLAVLISSIVFSMATEGGARGTAMGMGAIGLGCLGSLLSFVLGIIALLRVERPLWPAVIASLLSAAPALIGAAMLIPGLGRRLQLF